MSIAKLRFSDSTICWKAREGIQITLTKQRFSHSWCGGVLFIIVYCRAAVMFDLVAYKRVSALWFWSQQVHDVHLLTEQIWDLFDDSEWNRWTFLTCYTLLRTSPQVGENMSNPTLRRAEMKTKLKTDDYVDGYISRLPMKTKLKTDDYVARYSLSHVPKVIDVRWKTVAFPKRQHLTFWRLFDWVGNRTSQHKVFHCNSQSEHETVGNLQNDDDRCYVIRLINSFCNEWLSKYVNPQLMT